VEPRARRTQRRPAHLSAGRDGELRAAQTAISVFGPGAASHANILQGIVIGIGFIGAGAIIRQGDITTGNATAASIWTVGVIGAAVGYDYYDIGIILAAANLGVLLIPTPLRAGSSAPDSSLDDN
jgi:putative Mg2+ transporter-C (MgtC) family protein